MDPPIVHPPPGRKFFELSRVTIVFASLASGVVGTCFGHPLDLIKVRLQARSDYKGSWDCFSQTLKNEGLPGLFRGIGPPLFGSSLLNIVAFSSYSVFNDLQLDYKQQYEPGARLASYNYSISGIGVGLCCAPVVCPIEVVKVRMQLDRGNRRNQGVTKGIPLQRLYKGSWDCFRKTWRNEGIFGLYTGFGSTTLRDVSYSVTYFSVYEPLKQFIKAHLPPSGSGPSDPPGFSPLPIILSGGTSGALAWTVALPFDCAKTLIQQPMEDKDKGNKLAVLKAHYTRLGIRGFYSGWIPTIMRAFAVSATRFLVYESSLFGLNKLWKKHFG